MTATLPSPSPFTPDAPPSRSFLRHWSLTVPRRFAMYACVRRAIDLEEGRVFQEEPAAELLHRLARTPDDIVRVIILFVGDGGVQRRS